MAGGKRWLIDYQPTSVVLEVLPPFDADFDEDGDVDGADLVEWRAGFGTSGAAVHMDGDANGDLDVDGSDFLTWQRQLGGSASVTALSPAASAVPEPSEMFLALLMGVAFRWAYRSPFVTAGIGASRSPR